MQRNHVREVIEGGCQNSKARHQSQLRFLAEESFVIHGYCSLQKAPRRYFVVFALVLAFRNFVMTFRNLPQSESSHSVLS